MAKKAYDILNSQQISKLLGSSQGADPNKPVNAKSIFGDPYVQDGPGTPSAVAGVARAQAWDPSKLTTLKPITTAPGFDRDITQPGLGEQSVAKHLDSLFAPTNSQGLYDAGAFKNPTASETFFGQNSGAFTTPGAAEDWFGQNSSQFSTPGAAENWFAQNGSQFSAPGAAEQWWAQNQGQFNTPGAAENFFAKHEGDLESMPDPTNRAEEAYQSSKSRRPDIAADPGLEPYYNEAEARGTRQLNKRAAAMGNYGSSVALGEVGNLVTGLEAEKANREADYNLKRIAEQRAWEQLAGEMASSADSSSLGISQNELSQLLGFGNLAQAAQQGSLSRLLGAAGTAQGVQGAATQRLSAGSAASQGAQGAQTDRLSAGSAASQGAQGAAISRLNSGVGAAAQASNADLARQGQALDLASSADTQGRANLATGLDAAFRSQDARMGRINTGQNALSSIINSIVGLSDTNQERVVNSDEQYRQAKGVYGEGKANQARARADAEAERNTQMWLNIFTAALAAV